MTQGRFPFRRCHRITAKRDFTRVMQGGKRCTHGFFVVTAIHRGDGEPARLGLAVSRRIGNAVRRNKVRRRLKESFRLSLPLLSTGWDVMVVARPGAFDAPFTQVNESLLHCLRRLRVLAP